MPRACVGDRAAIGGQHYERECITNLTIVSAMANRHLWTPRELRLRLHRGGNLFEISRQLSRGSSANRDKLCREVRRGVRADRTRHNQKSWRTDGPIPQQRLCATQQRHAKVFACRHQRVECGTQNARWQIRPVACAVGSSVSERRQRVRSRDQ